MSSNGRLKSFSEILPLLSARRVCLPAFDIAGGQSDFLAAVLTACRQARSPAMLLVWAPAAKTGLEVCVDLVRSMAGRMEVPAVLHLDHGKDEAIVEQALKAGFASVMFDGSACPLEENIRRTREMARLAHDRGATIEGELGRLGQEQAQGKDQAVLTDPAEAGRFVRETGVDVLAPSVGNAHGFYKLPPRLRFDLIEQIALAAGVPLSLHGGTGIPLADVRRAGELGVRKMNVATQLHKEFADALKLAAGAIDQAWSWPKALASAGAALTMRVAQYLGELEVQALT